MEQPFDPEPLLRLAEELATPGEDGEEAPEIKLRAAVGRAYYAVFHVARERTGVIDREGIHATVVYQVRRRYGHIVGEKQNRIKLMREVADYEFPPIDSAFSDWQKNWTDVRLLSAQVLEKLKNPR